MVFLVAHPASHSHAIGISKLPTSQPTYLQSVLILCSVGSQQQQMGPKNAPRGGPRVKKDKKAANLYRIGGVDLPYDPELTLDTSGPTPLFPVCCIHDV